MKANAKLYKGNGAALKAVNDGQVDSAVIYHYYFMRDHLTTGQDTNNSELYYFKNQDPGAFISTSGGGVLASSKHLAEAQAFLKFITSKEGQTILAKGDSMQYPVGVGVPSNPGLTPLSDLQPPKVDPAKLNSKKVIDLHHPSWIDVAGALLPLVPRPAATRIAMLAAACGRGDLAFAR